MRPEALEPRRLFAGPIADAGGPYFVNEGGQVDLNGLAVGTITQWEWDFDYSASAGFQADRLGPSTRLDAVNLDGPLTLTVALRVTDDQNQTHIDTAILNVSNVAPFCGLGVARTDTGVATTAQVFNIIEPSIADRASLRYSYDFDNNGTFELVNTTLTSVVIPSNYLFSLGNRVARVRIEDKDGAGYNAAGAFNIAPGFEATISEQFVPAHVWEGTAILLSGYVGNSNLYTLTSYGWDFDYDGITFDTDMEGFSGPLPPIDGPTQRTIAFRITFGGQESIDTRAVTFHNSPPTVTGRTGPTSVPEGSVGTLFGVSGATDPNPADASNLRFSFDTDGDGTFDVIDSASPQTTIPASVVADGPRSLTLHARVTDDDGDSTDYAYPLSVTNVLPVITLTGPAWIRAGQPYPLTIGYADVGLDSPRRIVVDWGDGVEEQLQPGVFQASHVLTQVRTQNIIVRVTDDDVAFNSAKFISVEGPPILQNFAFAVDGPGSPNLFVPFGPRGLQLTVLFAARYGEEFDPLNLMLINRASGEVVPTTPGSPGLLVSGGPDSTSYNWRWPSGLPDGEYRATLPAGSVLGADGLPTTADRVIDFHVLAGDLNRDRRVDFDDLLTLAQNFGKSRQTYSQGNLDYSADGIVGFDDLLILAQRYGTSLSIASPNKALMARTNKRQRGFLSDLA